MSNHLHKREQIFIAHSEGDDITFLEKIDDALKDAGHEVFFDKKIKKDGAKTIGILETMADADVLILLVSERAIDSGWFETEFKCAQYDRIIKSRQNARPQSILYVQMEESVFSILENIKHDYFRYDDNLFVKPNTWDKPVDDIHEDLLGKIVNEIGNHPEILDEIQDDYYFNSIKYVSKRLAEGFDHHTLGEAAFKNIIPVVHKWCENYEDCKIRNRHYFIILAYHMFKKGCISLTEWLRDPDFEEDLSRFSIDHKDKYSLSGQRDEHQIQRLAQVLETGNIAPEAAEKFKEFVNDYKSNTATRKLSIKSSRPETKNLYLIARSKQQSRNGEVRFENLDNANGAFEQVKSIMKTQPKNEPIIFFVPHEIAINQPLVDRILTEFSSVCMVANSNGTDHEDILPTLFPLLEPALTLNKETEIWSDFENVCKKFQQSAHITN